MSLPNSLRAYADCEKLYSAAVEDPKGIRACLGTYAACIGMRTRMHYYRNLDRGANANTYPEGHQLHGTSAYDDFVVQILRDEDNQFWLYIQPRSGQILHIEGLSEVPALLDADSDEIHMLEGPK